MKNFDTQIRAAAPVVLRVSLSLVFFWFGIQQALNPEKWVAFLPNFLDILPIDSTVIVILNGWFEIIAATALLIGLYARVFAGLLALHLLGITISLGWGSTGVRDFGLTFATLTLAMQGAGPWSFDKKRDKKPD